MENIVEVSNLTKAFKANPVLNGVNFSVPKGSVLGVLGSNGAGKTTLIESLIGVTKTDSGSCKLFGDTAPNLSAETKHRIGYVPQESELINWMKVGQLIQYNKSFYEHWDNSLVEKLMIDWGLGYDQKIAKLSVGQKQKLSIILAMAHGPELLILDEPVASLDPVSRRKFIKQLIDINIEQEKTILFSTHITSDLERVAAQVLILRNGVSYYQGDIDELKEKVVRLHLQSDHEFPESLSVPSALTTEVYGKNAIVVTEDFNQVNVEQLGKQYNATVRIESMSLEDIFVELHA